VNIIDWEAVKASYWGGTDNLNIKRKKQAEFLVSGDLSPDYITTFGCYNAKAKDKIKMMPQAYY